ncbi:MAG: YfcE family phosphodiesterase, partial [Elusimicrobiota bacterium]|nr:YfcE family phosphodiesterase [Elusimicrobiota bacterium]
MLIGILSDSHNDSLAIDKAIDFFNLRGVSLVLHCGDFSLTRNAKQFEKLKCGFIAVFGNNDFDRVGMENIISVFGSINVEPYKFKTAGKIIVMSHRPLGFIDHEADYMFYGHTHKAMIDKAGRT